MKGQLKDDCRVKRDDHAAAMLAIAMMSEDQIKAASGTETRFVLLGHWLRFRHTPACGWSSGKVMAWSEDMTRVELRWSFSANYRCWVHVTDTLPDVAESDAWPAEDAAECRALARRWRGIYDALDVDQWWGFDPLCLAARKRLDGLKHRLDVIRRRNRRDTWLMVINAGGDR